MIDTLISIVFILFVIGLVKPGAEVFNRIPFLANKSNKARRLIFFAAWFVVSMFLTSLNPSEPSSDTDKDKAQSSVTKEAEPSTSESDEAAPLVKVVNDKAVILGGKDTLRFDGSGNVEWTAVGMNVGSSARLNVDFTEPIGVYPASTKFDSSNSDGYVYRGFQIVEGEYGVLGLYDFKGGDESIRIGRTSESARVFTKADFSYLQSAIELDCKTQIKPLEYYDIKGFISSVKFNVSYVTEDGKDDAKREYTISDDEALNVILNGIFPDKDN